MLGQNPTSIIRRKDIVKLVLTPLFDENSDEEDAVFRASFDPSTGLTTVTSEDHPDMLVVRMHKLTPRKLERFVRKLEHVNAYTELEVESGVFVIADRGNLYIYKDSAPDSCWRMDPTSLLRSMDEIVAYHAL
jgi:hypothetical protein